MKVLWKGGEHHEKVVVCYYFYSDHVRGNYLDCICGLSQRWQDISYWYNNRWFYMYGRWHVGEKKISRAVLGLPHQGI